MLLRLTGWLTDKKCFSSNLMSPVQLLGPTCWEKIRCQQVVPWLPHVHHGTNAHTNTHINNTLQFKGLFNLNFLVHSFSPGYLILGVRSQTVQHNKILSLLEYGSHSSTQEVCNKKIATRSIHSEHLTKQDYIMRPCQNTEEKKKPVSTNESKTILFLY